MSFEQALIYTPGGLPTTYGRMKGEVFTTEI